MVDGDVVGQYMNDGGYVPVYGRFEQFDQDRIFVELVDVVREKAGHGAHDLGFAGRQRPSDAGDSDKDVVGRCFRYIGQSSTCHGSAVLGTWACHRKAPADFCRYRSADSAALKPHMPCAPAPGGLDAEQR